MEIMGWGGGGDGFDARGVGAEEEEETPGRNGVGEDGEGREDGDT